MDQLTKFLVRELVDGQSVTAIYGGGFKPPTKGHFDLVKTALKDFKDIDKFLIYVGGGVRDGIEQEQSIQVWDIYKELLPSKVQIEPSASPIGDILRYAKNHPDEKVYFVLGYREGREDDLQDVKNRTKGVEEKYPNIEVRVIKTPAGDMSGTNARKALQKGDKEKFFTYLPTEIPANEKEDIYKILEPNIFKEGSCGYDIDVKTGKKLDTPGGLEEGKQVGLLYHFTSTNSLDKILKDNKINGSFMYEVGDKELYGVSTTRNKNLNYDLQRNNVRITLDGNKLSNNYKITPRDYFERQYNIPDNPQTIDEDEEVILTPKGYINNIKNYILAVDKVEDLEESRKKKPDPKKGTGKKPKGSGRRLYTDEDPTDTVSIKFSTKQDIIDTLSKASFKSKSHARQSQIINLIHQRVRAAYERAKDPEVKKRLKTALDYAEQRKEASKEKTQRLKKENVAPNHTGKAAPFGSGYKPLKENTIPSIDVLEKIAELTNYMREKGYNIDPVPSIIIIDNDVENAGEFLGKTAYYDPINKSITLYTYGRHPKDIVRSFSHEMIHHIQNLEGRLGNVSTTNTLEDDHINNLEKEANLKGTMTFRNWTDGLQEDGQKTSNKNMDDYKKQNNPSGKVKDPFGLNQYARELAQGLEEKEQVNELAIAPLLIKGLIGIITTVGAGLIRGFGSIMVDRVIDGAILTYQDIKNIVAPEPYIKFLKGLEKNDEFNKQFIELTLSQRKPDAKVLLGSEWENAMTSLPAFVEAFDKFTAEENISGDAKRFLLARIQRSMREAYMSGWRDIHKVLKNKYPELTKDLNEQQLTEGRYDKFTNELSSLAFELFKDGYTVGRKVVDETFTVGPAEEDPDIVSNDFEFDFVVQAKYTDDTYKVDGGANAGFDDEGDEITPLLTVRFEIPKDIDWQRVSFDIKDVIRHELEHLTQDGANLKGGTQSDDPKLVRPSKYMEDDQFIRDMIDANLLPKAEYFKLEKEVDAMLQGLYFKAKKSRKPFLEVIDDYLDTQPINQKERKEILDLWAKRAKALGLPSFTSANVKETSYLHDTGVEKKDEEMRGTIEGRKPVIFCDMDGVLVDFDEGYKQLTGVTTHHADSQGKDEFWKLFRDGLKDKDISERSYWANLDWMPDGKQLWDYIKEYNPYVLTAPSVNFDIPFEERYKMENNESMQGKTEWVQRLPNMKKIYFRSAGRKADFAGPGKILIDDRKDTIDSWNANGGIGILHTSTANTIKQLQDLGL